MKKYIPTHDTCDVAIKHIRHIKHISLKPFENKNPTNYSRQYKKKTSINACGDHIFRDALFD